MRNILGIELNLIGRYGGLTGVTWFEGVGKNKFLTCWIFILRLARGRKLTNYMHA
jgi:hypothetical protein